MITHLALLFVKLVEVSNAMVISLQLIQAHSKMHQELLSAHLIAVLSFLEQVTPQVLILLTSLVVYLLIRQMVAQQLYPQILFFQLPLVKKNLSIYIHSPP
jgi:hypothetical protein